MLRSSRRPALVAGIALTLLLTGCGDEAPERPPTETVSADRSSPPLPPTFYVDPRGAASWQVTEWAQEGRAEDAATLRRISTRPTARWLVGDSATVTEEVSEFLAGASRSGQTPVLVTHNLPQRDCGRQGQGGAESAGAYQDWIRRVAAGVQGRPVTIVVEPGAVPDAVDRCVDDVDERLDLLRDAVTVLGSTGSARIYLDAGHPGWITDGARLAAALRRAGVAEADGFALNVANFVGTPQNVTYGHEISDALGGTTTFVIDTSRNGRGRYPGETVRSAPSWCNPPGRALGADPTTDTGLERVDALLWVKYPGESDGACRPGEPESGAWWPEYALGLARRAG
ncbi:glycoside hydrolase family 6 protein [Verrucosispora sp. NA02020]|uniref:glycoside hydrolase family 6 protein n=1 Tax=Verrucosispora sp. NA02020 TaxID=2742132 RepID=UPI0015910A30|nr:glycoside hydrolase family 6 protein [Verrucosispora sp. NA02020]QKW16064.1 glycoside hydrolase family 6 protein [Verrucosispora sp. NA02020]